MKDPISEFIGRLKKADDELTQAIASGINIHNFDGYQRMVGQLEGLKNAFDILNELLREDDEAE
jgi:aromatic ring-opening dioxygenase catalytic subunit (LigB family)